MPRVTVIPVIGEITHSRLDSLRGCHALHERAVTKPFQNSEEMGYAITDALHEIALSMAVSRRHYRIEEMAYILRFRA